MKIKIWISRIFKTVNILNIIVRIKIKNYSYSANNIYNI